MAETAESYAEIVEKVETQPTDAKEPEKRKRKPRKAKEDKEPPRENGKAPGEDEKEPEEDEKAPKEDDKVKPGKLQEKVNCEACGKNVSRSTLQYGKHVCKGNSARPPTPEEIPTATVEPMGPTRVVLDNYRRIKTAQIDSRRTKYAAWLEGF